MSMSVYPPLARTMPPAWTVLESSLVSAWLDLLVRSVSSTSMSVTAAPVSTAESVKMWLMGLRVVVRLVLQAPCVRLTLTSAPVRPARTEPNVWIDPTVTNVDVRRALKVLSVNVTLTSALLTHATMESAVMASPASPAHVILDTPAIVARTRLTNATVTLVYMEENALTWSTSTCVTVSKEPPVLTVNTISMTAPATHANTANAKMGSTNMTVYANPDLQVPSVT